MFFYIHVMNIKMKIIKAVKSSVRGDNTTYTEKN